MNYIVKQWLNWSPQEYWSGVCHKITASPQNSTKYRNPRFSILRHGQWLIMRSCALALCRNSTAVSPKAFKTSNSLFSPGAGGQTNLVWILTIFDCISKYQQLRQETIIETYFCPVWENADVCVKHPVISREIIFFLGSSAPSSGNHTCPCPDESFEVRCVKSSLFGTVCLV